MNNRLFLVGTLGALLGFTVSWKPTQQQLARHIVASEQLELAATDPKAATGTTDASEGYKQLDLGTQDPALAGVTVLYAELSNEELAAAKTVRYQIRLGTHAHKFCDDCIAPLYSVSERANNNKELALIISAAARKNLAEARKMGKESGRTETTDRDGDEKRDFTIDADLCSDLDITEKIECMQELASEAIEQCNDFRPGGRNEAPDVRRTKRKEKANCERALTRFTNGPFSRTLLTGLSSNNEEVRTAAVEARDLLLEEGSEALNGTKARLIQASMRESLKQAQETQANCKWAGVTKCQPGIAANAAKQVLHWNLTGMDNSGGNISERYGNPLLASLLDIVNSGSTSTTVENLVQNTVEEPLKSVFQADTSKGLDLTPILNKLGVGDGGLVAGLQEPQIDTDPINPGEGQAASVQGLARRGDGRGVNPQPYAGFGQAPAQGGQVVPRTTTTTTTPQNLTRQATLNPAAGVSRGQRGM